MKRHLIISLMALCLTARAISYQHIGDVSAQGEITLLTTLESWNASPFAGEDAVPRKQVETFLQVPEGTLPTISVIPKPYYSFDDRVTVGSAAVFNLSVSAPSTLSVTWSFLSNAQGNGRFGGSDDFSFLTLSRDGQLVRTAFLAGAEDLYSTSPLSEIVLHETPAFANEPTRRTDWATLLINLDQPGDYRLGLGVVELLDTYTASGLEISSVNVPDGGSTLALLSLALCGVAGMAVQTRTHARR